MAILDALQLWAASSEREALVSAHRGHRSSLALALAPMFELSGAGREHTLYTLLHRACTPRHLTTNGAPVMILELSAHALLQREGAPFAERTLSLVGLADACAPGKFEQYRVDSEELPAGCELRLRVRDISNPTDRRWRLQRRWPFVSRSWPVFQAALVVLVP